jgi:O-acetyl-ADP-ribose deacetylase (regulator of RNase III)
MITFTEGNLLNSESDALINTVNEVGVMGKGIALMFREAFPKNTREYELACKRGDVHVGKMFVTATDDTRGPKWIINFPTKKHWRNPSKIEWIRDGLLDLANVIQKLKIKSVAVPPLGCGNGGLDWGDVRQLIVATLGSLQSVDVLVFQPTSTYQNDPKQSGAGKLTPARALIIEMVRRYAILGFECSMLEVQKLAWFLERGLKHMHLDDPLKLHFHAQQYGPYADTLRHVLNNLDGSYLHSERRIADASPYNVVGFNWDKADDLEHYLQQASMKKYGDVIDWTQKVIEGFESPFGMELLATVDWLLSEGKASPTLDSIREGLRAWPHGKNAATRKDEMFDNRVLRIALDRIVAAESFEGSQAKLSFQ